MTDLETLIDSVDIVEYVQQFTDLTLRGREFWGLSPLKQEKTPSFSIDPEKQVFCDFSSGKSGGIINFIKDFYSCNTTAAIKKLEEYAGVSVSDVWQRRMNTAKVCKRYQPRKTTKTQEPKPNILPESIMDKYEWNEDKFQIWVDEGISLDVMWHFGVRYDPVTNRIVYPIRDITGRIINVGARTLDPNYKEKGIRKYSYIQGWGGGMEVIYGLYDSIEIIKKKKYLILFEGAKSVFKAASWGIKNTGAILTSHLNSNQIRILLTTCCQNEVTIVFALDKDIDILHDNNIKKLKKYVNIHYLDDTNNLLDEKDSPVDKGFEVFKTLCKERKRLR